METKDALNDTKVHEDILSAVNFNRTPAYAHALNRYQKLGMTEQEARELLKVKEK